MAEQKKVRRNPFVGTKFSSGKAEFEARIGAIEKNLASAVISGSVHTVDYLPYAVRHLAADTTVELMQSSDAKNVGITNVNKRQLEANTYALCTGIQLLEAKFEKSAPAEAEIKSASFGVISSEIANGELEVKNGDKILYPRSSCEVFRTTDSESLQGYHALECPKFFIPLTDIVPTLYVPASTQGENKSKAIKIVFHCVKTNKA